MNKKQSTINSELQELKLFLEKYPEEAAELATIYFEDYLILLDKYEELEENLEKIERGTLEYTSIHKPIFAEITLSLEQEFSVACLKLHLNKYPDESEIFALSYFEDFLYLVLEYQKLESRLLMHSCLNDLSSRETIDLLSQTVADEIVVECNSATKDQNVSLKEDMCDRTQEVGDRLQNFKIIYADISFMVTGKPEQITALFAQMQSNPSFAREILTKAQLLLNSKTDFKKFSVE